jgi:hypothetical protein
MKTACGLFFMYENHQLLAISMKLTGTFNETLEDNHCSAETFSAVSLQYLMFQMDGEECIMQPFQ